MCCFSRDVERVANTRIFGRLAGRRQAVVYAMEISAAEDLAMVLPLPTPPDSAEDALTFVDLEEYPKFFEDLEKGFPPPPSRSWGFGDEEQGPGEGTLEVHRVGAYDASFVPRPADFRRLDERFRLPEDVWQHLPGYADWGFAVFKLRQGADQSVHPMAFWFPTRHPDRLFFPTVHIHHGEVEAEAEFDHLLYCQVPRGRSPSGDFARTWAESPEPARRFVRIPEAKGLVTGSRHAYRRDVRGVLPNEDLYVPLD